MLSSSVFIAYIVIFVIVIENVIFILIVTVITIMAIIMAIIICITVGVPNCIVTYRMEFRRRKVPVPKMTVAIIKVCKSS